MNDINFRKALSYAFDYDGFINNILSGSVARNPVPVPNTIWGAPQGVKATPSTSRRPRNTWPR